MLASWLSAWDTKTGIKCWNSTTWKLATPKLIANSLLSFTRIFDMHFKSIYSCTSSTPTISHLLIFMLCDLLVNFRYWFWLNNMFLYCIMIIIIALNHMQFNIYYKYSDWLILLFVFIWIIFICHIFWLLFAFEYNQFFSFWLITVWILNDYTYVHCDRLS